MSTQPNRQKVNSRVLIIVPTLGKRLDLLELTLKSITSQKPLAPDIVIVYPLKNKAVKVLADTYGAESAQDAGTLSGAINVGIMRLKPHHSYVGWLGDDDLLRPSSVATMTELLDEQKDAVLGYGYCDYIDDNGKLIFTNRSSKLAPWIMTWGPNLVPLIGMLYRASAIKKVGEFDTDLKYAMDLDILLRLRKLGKFARTNKVVGAFRWHSSSTTVANRDASLKEAEQIKRRHLSRRVHKIAPLWEAPVRSATRVAAKRVSKKAKNIQNLKP